MTDDNEPFFPAGAILLIALAVVFLIWMHR